MDNEKTILSNVIDGVLEKEVPLGVDINPINWFHSILQRLKIKPVKKTYVLRPLSYGKLLKVSKLLLSIGIDIFKKGDVLNSVYKAMQEHGETLVEVLAIVIHPYPTDPPRSLVVGIMNDFSSKDVEMAMNIVFSQMGIQAFMNSIISLKGLNVIEMSPKEQGSSIAPGMLSEAS